MGYTAGVRFPTGKIFFSSPRCPDNVWDPSSLLYKRYSVIFSWDKEAVA
jgi:hypothetical protein